VKVGDLVKTPADLSDLGLVIEKTGIKFRVFWWKLRRAYVYDLHEQALIVYNES